jgi:hypothetical protein
MIRTVVHFVDSSAFGGNEQALLHLLAGLDRRRWRSILLHHAEPGLAPLLEEARRLNVETRIVPKLSRIPRMRRQHDDNRNPRITASGAVA